MKKTETQYYQQIHKDGSFEIRYYPEYTVAEVYTALPEFKSATSKNFRILSSYIFGQNVERNKIAMTSPVQIEMDNQGSYMRFIMPAQHNIQSLPKPLSSNIKIHDAKAEFVAVLSFSGFANAVEIQKQSQILEKYLDEKKIKHQNNFRFLGYNPPFQLVNRRNEIIVTIDFKQ
jgi:hypothetical protein